LNRNLGMSHPQKDISIQLIQNRQHSCAGYFSVFDIFSLREGHNRKNWLIGCSTD
jgi:hypothetical protein